LLLRGFACRV